MKLREIAEKIPPEYRKEILELNLIRSARANAADEAMHYLSTIWKNYLDPQVDTMCNVCCERLLKNFREIEKELIEIEKEEKLLGSV